MFFSDYMNCNFKGHKNFEFVDCNLDDDNCLFIDPELISRNADSWSQSADVAIKSFFDCMYNAVRINNLYGNPLFAHCGELNGTKLGYGKGDNGKGRTLDGFAQTIEPLTRLIPMIPTIDKPSDLPLFVSGFAEDNMSDLITNICHDMLNSFTAEQMIKYGIPSTGTLTFWTWNHKECKWISVTRESWLYNGAEILLVPKRVVRNRYIVSAQHYMTHIIIDRYRRETHSEKLSKKDIRSNFKNESPTWVYDKAIEYSSKFPDMLLSYHNQIPKFYNSRGCMTDEALDAIVYGVDIEEVG